MSEFSFTETIVKGIRDTGALVFVLRGNALQSGLPDRLVVSTIWSGFIEFKDEGGTLRANQRCIGTDVARRGFKVAVLAPDASDARYAVISPWPLNRAELPPPGTSMTPQTHRVLSNGRSVLEFLRNYHQSQLDAQALAEQEGCGEKQGEN